MSIHKIKDRMVRIVDNLNEFQTIDWDKGHAKIINDIYKDYEMMKHSTGIGCTICGEITEYVLIKKDTNEVKYHYCDKCVALFKRINEELKYNLY